MSKALELAEMIEGVRAPYCGAAAAELRRRAAVEAERDELLKVLQEIYETLAWDHLPPLKRDMADRARAAIAKATGETK